MKGVARGMRILFPLLGTCFLVSSHWSVDSLTSLTLFDRQRRCQQKHFRPRIMSAATTNTGNDSPLSSHEPPKQVVIAGAGIMGVSTAYFLQHTHGISCTLVDPTGTIGPGASGKAGGFLAQDWNDGSATQQLTRRSFALHQQLADTLGADSIQYRRLTCAAVSVVKSAQQQQKRPKGKKLDGIEWAQIISDTDNDGTKTATVVGTRPLGGKDTIAQVHPKLLCERLWEETSRKGSSLMKGKVLGVEMDDSGRCTGAKLADGTIIQTDAVLFACGPWTAQAIMKGVKYHSAVVRTDRVLEQCVFFSGFGDPEVYVRPDQTAYCTGFPEPACVVKEEPGEEHVDPERIFAILTAVSDATAIDRGALELQKEPQLQQACYLPTTNDGIPIMGSMGHGNGSTYICAGHSCWGILLGPAAGECMASLIATGKETAHVDLKPFRPSRYGSFELIAR